MEVVSLVSGDALEIAFDALVDVVKKNIQFKSKLISVQAALTALEKIIKEQIPSNAELPGIADIMTIMDEGRKLIQNCAKKQRWYKGLLKKSGLTDKLNSLEKSLGDLLPKLTLYLVSYQTKLIQDMCEKKILTKIAGYRCPLPEPPSFRVGFDGKILGELRKLIMDSEKSIIVLTAPAGCGKTTLAQMLCHDKEVNETFKMNIYFVDVSKNPSLDHVVNQLFLHRGYNYILPATTDNERCTGSYLEEFLEADQQPLLLVLDGVWCDRKYETLLHEFEKLNRPKLKILVTSRIHFPRFSLYYLNWLGDKDANDLFRHLALNGDKSSEIPELRSLKIVQYCKGLPLAITTVGRLICGKKDEFWNRLCSTESILKFGTDVRDKLKGSLKVLDTEDGATEDILLKNLFLDLAAFPEGRLISAIALIDMWSESYNLDDDTDTDMTCILKLYELEYRTVANLIFPIKASVHGYYSEHFVTQHELLRELAVIQTRLNLSIEERERLFINICGDQLDKELEQQVCRPMKARLLAISTDRVFSGKWQLPDVEVLILNLQTNTFKLPEFMKEMGKLKVLIITYYGCMPATAELSNFEVFSSLSSLKRVRLERISVPSIAKDLFQLKSVQKISLFMCDIGQGFSNIAIKFSEALPKLEEMNIDYCNNMVQVPRNLCAHDLLKKLSITNSHELLALPEEIGKLQNLEQLRLLACTNLLELPGSISKLRRLKLLDISHCSSLKNLPPGIDFTSLKSLIRTQCHKLELVRPDSTECFISGV